MSGSRRPETDNDDLLTPDKVAALLSVSVRSIRRYAAEGQLAPVHLGRNVRYRRADVERLIASGTVRSSHDTGHSGPQPADTARGGQRRAEADMSGVSAHEPIEAAYRVTPAEIEQAVSRTSAQYMGDLRTMLAEVGKVYEGQLAAKDAALEAKDQALAIQTAVLGAKDETIAELRRRAEVAEAEVTRRAEGAAQAAQHAPSATVAFVEAQEDTVGLWGRLARLLGR